MKTQKISHSQKFGNLEVRGASNGFNILLKNSATRIFDMAEKYDVVLIYGKKVAKKQKNTRSFVKLQISEKEQTRFKKIYNKLLNRTFMVIKEISKREPYAVKINNTKRDSVSLNRWLEEQEAEYQKLRKKWCQLKH